MGKFGGRGWEGGLGWTVKQGFFSKPLLFRARFYDTIYVIRKIVFSVEIYPGIVYFSDIPSADCPFIHGLDGENGVEKNPCFSFHPREDFENCEVSPKNKCRIQEREGRDH